MHHEPGTLRIGTSGYVYRHWRGGVFYPAGLRVRDELAWYAARFGTVELNAPFYRIPSEAAVIRWRDESPADFVFAVKVNRVVSHARRLRDVDAPIAEFLARVGRLGDKLGPLLIQIPPQFRVDLRVLEGFLARLPDEYRWVLEVRHPSWQVPESFEALGRRGVALCVPVGGVLQPDLVTTAPFTYLRFHAGASPGGGFTDHQLRTWAARVRALARSGKQVYAYFNNDRGGHAPDDALRLRNLLGLAR